MLRAYILIAATIGIGCLLYMTDSALAASTHHRQTLQTWTTKVRDFHVRAVSYHPGDHYRMVVRYSKHPRTVPHWAGAQHRHTKTVAAINGNTWVWNTGRPVGTIRTNGHWVNRPSHTPAVGFKANGQIVFGARPAKHAGARNIISGKGYLLRGGHVQHHFPWATGAQVRCASRRSDSGYGCWRSVEARWHDGRVGLVEIAYASMSQAAAVLKRMHVTDALTGDSGGSANIWTRSGSGGCSRLSNGRVFGSCFSPLHAAGFAWERAVPDVAMIVRTRAHR